jgi:hypothetical protein
VTSERAFYSGTFNEVIGTPNAGLGAEWWFPWYDTQGMTTWILIGNPSASQSTTCHVHIGGVRMSPEDGYVIPPNDRVTPLYPGLLDGPVKVSCTLPVFTSERALYNGSFNEVMGIAPASFSTEQWFPWYDSIFMTTWVLIGNPSSTQSTTCHVHIGGVQMSPPSGYIIPPNGRETPSYGGVLDGPVKVSCTLPVFASERAIYNGGFNEVMGISPGAFNVEQWFPRYDNVGMSMWVLIANPQAGSATCHVFVAGIERSPLAGYTIPAGGRVTPIYTGVRDGPVRVVCDVAVYATERALFNSSFSEIVGVVPQ